MNDIISGGTVLSKETKDPRYPYTYAADFVRSILQRSESMNQSVDPKDSFLVPLLGRSQAAMIWHELASVWGVDDRQAAEKLADMWKKLQLKS
jgi:hypothetical protein